MKTRFLLTLSLLAIVSLTLQAQLQEIDWADTLDRANWELVEAVNYHPNNTGERAFDGDFGTHWSTTWGGNSGYDAVPFSHYITIDMKEAIEVTGLIYLPRQDRWSSNGTIMDYTIVVSYSTGNELKASRPPVMAQRAVSDTIAWTPEMLERDTEVDGERIDTAMMPMSHSLKGRYLRLYCDTAMTTGEAQTLINELWVKGKKIIDYEGMVSRDYWKVIKTTDDRNPQHQAIDGDFATVWQPNWNPEVPYPHEIVIDLSEETKIDSLLYSGRQDLWGANGTLKKYEIYVSNDTNDWGAVESIDSLDWYGVNKPANAYDSSVVHKNPMMMVLDSVATGRYIKIVTVEGLTDKEQTVIGELFVYGDVTGANYEDASDSIANPGFEDGTTGWTAGGNLMKFDATDDASAGDSAGLVVTGGGNVKQYIDLEADTRYKVSFMSKQPKGGKINVQLRHGDGGRFVGDVNAINATDWTEFSFMGISNLEVNEKFRLLFWNSAGDDSIFVDEFKITKMGPAHLVAPVANAGTDVDSLTANDSIMLDGSGSSHEKNKNLSYMWTADEGLTFDNASAKKPYIKAGEFTKDTVLYAMLVVSEGIVESDVDSVMITIDVAETTPPVNQAPVADAGADQSVDEGATVTLDGSASSDPDEDDITFKWTVPTGITLDDVTVEKPTFTAPVVDAVTEYEFTLIVNDGKLDSDPAKTKVTVNPVVGLNDNVFANTQIFPNPLVNKLNIVTDQVINKVTLVAVAGTVVAEYTNVSNTIDISDITSGIYIVSIQTESGTLNQKVVIKK